MIKAVFFDWFNTLAQYEPSREELQQQVLKEFGIDVSLKKIIPALLAADREYFEENAVSPVRKRTPDEQATVYAQYQRILLTELKVNLPDTPDLFVRIMKRAQELSQGMKFILFDDVLPTLQKLKETELTLGLLTNLDRDMEPVCNGLGLEPFIDFIVTSGEAGADKPEPPIFLVALRQAGVNASEAIHVGDQYKLDVAGAEGVGINPILLDRHNQYSEISNCPRIQNLAEITNYF